MRKLIRSRATKAFLTLDGSWTDDLQNACDFTGQDLRSVQAGHPLQQIEVYYHFGPNGPSQYDFTISAG